MKTWLLWIIAGVAALALSGCWDCSKMCCTGPTGAPTSSPGTGSFSGRAASGDTVDIHFEGPVSFAGCGGQPFIFSGQFDPPGPTVLSPAGAGGSVEICISIDHEPVPGTYRPATTGIDGVLDVGYGGNGTSDDFLASSSIPGADCGGAPDGGQGDWTLTITSAARGDTSRWVGPGELWAPHGSLTATLTDADGGTGTLQLTF